MEDSSSNRRMAVKGVIEIEPFFNSAAMISIVKNWSFCEEDGLCWKILWSCSVICHHQVYASAVIMR